MLRTVFYPLLDDPLKLLRSNVNMESSLIFVVVVVVVVCRFHWLTCQDMGFELLCKIIKQKDSSLY